ncbi:hypothetical protein JQC67_17325 [Aurantibacter crassamenti]|uniref:hypothetical protein n=1 Tax=Aurantibacter crassamenti TaxID=1837375 RepID=UPI001939CEE5|nr:hypothetical protein [Aurantibacter crassamenti]MBM1107920.1 hypothetical protein [Aurantibacter crassamenti]
MNKVKTLASITLLFLIVSSCVKEVKETIDSIECATLLGKLSQDDSDSCAEALADIEKIERHCSEFLSDESKELIATLRANCTDN